MRSVFIQMENKIFRWAIICSALIHFAFFLRISFLKNSLLWKPKESMEVVYFESGSIKRSEENDSKDTLSTLRGPEKRTDVRLRKPRNDTSLIKDLSKLFGKIDMVPKKPAQVKMPAVRRRITVPPIKSEKIDNPQYQNYYQIVRKKIRERAYLNYDQYDTGEVYLTFVLSKNGNLRNIQLIREKTQATEYLRSISQKSVRQADPFPPFPSDLSYPELTFNVIISYTEVAP